MGDFIAFRGAKSKFYDALLVDKTVVFDVFAML